MSPDPRESSPDISGNRKIETIHGPTPSLTEMEKNVACFVKNPWSFPAIAVFWLILLVINLSAASPIFRFRGIRYSGVDFDQYYGAGVAVATGLGTEMYPDSAQYVRGHRPAEAPYKPRLSAELARRGATSQTKNIYPPPTALLFVPLATWDFVAAQRFFITILAFCTAAFLWLLFRECLDWGLSPATSNAVVFFAGTGLPMTESVMLANMTPIIGLCGLLALRGIRRNAVFPTIAGFAVAGLVKGFSAVWIPALFVCRRRKIVAWGAAAGVLVLAVSFMLCGNMVGWREYITAVLPASRGNLYRIGDSNLCLPSFCAWFFGWKQVPNDITTAFSVLQLVLYAVSYLLVWRTMRNRTNRNAEKAVALAFLSSTIVFQTFSTVCWPHYSVNILPFFPAAIAAAGRNRRSLAVLLCGFSLTWFPVGNALKHLSGISVFGFGRFFGYMMLLGWALFELAKLSTGPSLPRTGKDVP